ESIAMVEAAIAEHATEAGSSDDDVRVGNALHSLRISLVRWRGYNDALMVQWAEWGSDDEQLHEECNALYADIVRLSKEITSSVEASRLASRQRMEKVSFSIFGLLAVFLTLLVVAAVRARAAVERQNV